MTEQDKLRKALEAAQEGLRYGSEFGAEAISILVPHLKRLVDAAEQSLTFRRLPLPEELDDKALLAMWIGQASTITKSDSIRAGYKALYEHLTKPKTKVEEFWHIEYSFREFEGLDWKPQLSAYSVTKEGVKARDNWMASFKDDKRVACIRVTGPHQQEVPA